jgi:hypothetical protein
MATPTGKHANGTIAVSFLAVPARLVQGRAPRIPRLQAHIVPRAVVSVLAKLE